MFSPIFPMLAARPDGPVPFPCLASPKIDGIRALVRDGTVYSRSGNPIPNPHVQKLFGALRGYDGELVVGDVTAPDVFRQSQAVMRKSGEPDVRFFVFDWFLSPDLPYFHRLAPHIIADKMGQLGERARLTPQCMLYNQAQLDDFEALCLESGFEGVMLRNPDAPYKFGRCTASEGYLLKLKRFVDAEAEIIGMEEQRDASGRPKAVLGALHVRDVASGVEFSLGTGFKERERADFWRKGGALRGRYVRYRCFPVGVKDKPRFPVFSGLRSALDMEAAHA